MIVASFILAWTFVVGVAGELGEQARFRTMTDPFVVALGIVVAWSALQPLRRRVPAWAAFRRAEPVHRVGTEELSS